jgi:hypothetical protein
VEQRHGEPAVDRYVTAMEPLWQAAP